MTVRRQVLLTTTAVLLASAVVCLLWLRSSSLSSSDDAKPRVAGPASNGEEGVCKALAPRHHKSGQMGVVYTMTEQGLVVRNGAIPPPLAESDEEAAEAALEAEWDETVSALQCPVTGTRAAELQRRFNRLFNRLPKARRADALQSALNLLPDENSAVVVGLVFDRSQPDEIVNLAFSDVLNRSDEIKSGVIRRVARDPDHPNYVDARRLYDLMRISQ